MTEKQPIQLSPTMVNRANLFAIRQDSIDNDLTAQDICNMFNDFLMRFEHMEHSGTATTNVFLDAVEEIADAVLMILPYKLLDPRILYHPLMNFLHQMLFDILANWRASQQRLNIQETDIFLKIVLIFVHAAESARAPTAEEDRKKIQDILTTKRFLFLIQEQVEDCVLNKPDLNDDPNICTLGLLTIKLLQGAPFYYSTERNQCLLDDRKFFYRYFYDNIHSLLQKYLCNLVIMNCLDSYDYIQAVRQLQHDQPLTDIDRFLLFTCWEYVPFNSTTSSSSSSNTLKLVKRTQLLYNELLVRLERALDAPPPMTPSSVAYIFQRCTQLLNIAGLPSFDEHANQIVDRLTDILKNQSAKDPSNQLLIIVALEAFHNLSQNTDIRTIIKNRHLNSLFNNYTSTDNTEYRRLAFSILAETMDEQEVNNNPAGITAVFIDQLKQLNSNQNNSHTESALTSLKALMQHEQVKGEFIKQGGLETLTTFVRDGDASKQSDSQLEDALNILWSCTFNNSEVIRTLQQDEQFMARINQIQEKAKEEGNSSLEKAAEGLIWKVEKEEKFKEEQQVADAERKQRKAQKSSNKDDGDQEEEEEEEEDQYDMMISYSWADMDLAHRIFHHLTDKLGYKVWLDQQQMHGSTIQAMANAVDHSQFILMCMSETYKRSANCQSEAEYAFNRKKHIVPCKMKKDYAADGWLGFILGTRMYIDFGNYEFEKAMELLDNEIRLQKKKRKATKEAARAEKEAAAAAADSKREENEVEFKTQSVKT